MSKKNFPSIKGTDLFKALIKKHRTTGNILLLTTVLAFSVLLIIKNINLNATNFIEKKEFALGIKWIGVIDNGEGPKKRFWSKPSTWGEHGPEGSLHLLIFNSYMGNKIPPCSIKSISRMKKHIHLKGPTNNEWIDGDQFTYDPPLEICKLKTINKSSTNTDKLFIYIYESDPDLGTNLRDHDTIFNNYINPYQIQSHTIYSSNIIVNSKKIINEAKKNNAEKWFHKKICSDFMKIKTKKLNELSGLKKGMPKMYIEFVLLKKGEDRQYNYRTGLSAGWN